MQGPPPSPLATLEHCFRLLSRQPGALAIDGAAVHHGLPPRPIPLDELRGRLPQLTPQTRMTVMAALVRRARAGSPAWQVGLAGVLLPGLRCLASQHATTNPPAVAEAHTLTWFRAALATHGPASDQRIAWLLEATCAAQRSPGTATTASRRPHRAGTAPERWA